MKAPELIEGTPPKTLILTGDNAEQWREVLPLLTPVYLWIDRKAMRKMVRWRMTPEVMRILGIPADARCADPNCTSCDGLLHCEDHDTYMIDTNWHQTGWYFDA